jgi:homoserine kinase type II
MDVYVLQHVYERDEIEEIKMIGVYSIQERAKEAIERLKNQPGFVDHLEGFDIDVYPLDKDHWTEGFVTEYTSI